MCPDEGLAQMIDGHTLKQPPCHANAPWAIESLNDENHEMCEKAVANGQ
jgi:hypothetical protein